MAKALSPHTNTYIQYHRIRGSPYPPPSTVTLLPRNGGHAPHEPQNKRYCRHLTYHQPVLDYFSSTGTQAAPKTAHRGRLGLQQLPPVSDRTSCLTRARESELSPLRILLGCPACFKTERPSRNQDTARMDERWGHVESPNYVLIRSFPCCHESKRCNRREQFAQWIEFEM